ncbi:MAG: plasmid pRiA4b ORF-3 family protein, partial [Opitutaceae bacterium]
VDLPAGSSMKFLFDYGDSWRFELRLERVDARSDAAAEPEAIATIESAGEAPKQYPEWEE